MITVYEGITEQGSTYRKKTYTVTKYELLAFKYFARNLSHFFKYF